MLCLHCSSTRDHRRGVVLFLSLIVKDVDFECDVMSPSWEKYVLVTLFSRSVFSWFLPLGFFHQLFDIYSLFSVLLIIIFLSSPSIFWSPPLSGSTINHFSSSSSIIHLTPFVFPPLVLCFTLPLLPVLPLRLLINQRSQIFSVEGGGIFSLSFFLCLPLSLSRSPSLSVVMETSSSN